MYHFSGVSEEDALASAAELMRVPKTKRDPAEVALLLDLGARFRLARERKRLTLAQLAVLAGVSKNHIAAFEKGANISITHVARLIPHLDIATLNIGGVSIGIAPPVANEVRRHARAALREIIEVLDFIQGNTERNVDASEVPQIEDDLRDLAAKDPDAVVRMVRRLLTSGEISEPPRETAGHSAARSDRDVLSQVTTVKVEETPAAETSPPQKQERKRGWRNR
jgi:transcriptional regulator with XRE-family HTH domain